MARETKAQRDERLAAETAMREQVAKNTYLARMMAVFERANRVNFELQVRSGVFVLEDRDDRGEVFMLAAAWSQDNDERLQDLTWRVEAKEQAEAEAERRRQLRANALAKLSQEEREELGL